MKTKFNVLAVFILLGVLILSACGGAPAATEAFVVEAPLSYEEPAAQNAGGANDVAKEAGNQALPSIYATAMPPQDSAPGALASMHMIIKNAEIKLLVTDTDIAIDRATQVVGDAGGYIVSSRVWSQPHYDGKNYKYAAITIGIPVQEFEHTLSRLRGLSVQVLDESASGEDVTNQFVDLQSQLTNLEATRERIKTFLDSAKTVDEALRINQELSAIESQIEQIKGQMNYLEDRSAYSTITINFEPELPELEPVVTPTPNPWNPGETFNNAKETVTFAYQGIVNFLIWLFVVLIPILAPPALIIWGLWKLLTRRSRKPTQ
ncbi:DUF4349 domain-containing protein [Candidatus Villigracilis saccharophilus]|uniref:DUF4349 domain-containing protein n=1 Tax=Candidatus Villigracilis saccharophilus TaxID=3140684 RepID=UPI003135C0D2|nr:DUF4349 domain-containing protein [Anaerolineales bacterium]